MKLFLILSREEPISECPPKAVYAKTAEQAVIVYLKKVCAKDESFRDSVLDLGVNMTFMERFYLSSEQEVARFAKTSEIGTEEVIVKSRVRTFFAARPDIGERFIRYMDTKDRSLIDDEVFEFIAVNESEEEHGLVAIDPHCVEVLS